MKVERGSAFPKAQEPLEWIANGSMPTLPGEYAVIIMYGSIPRRYVYDWYPDMADWGLLAGEVYAWCGPLPDISDAVTTPTASEED